MNYYAVIDTNVLVSAYIRDDSIPGSVLELLFRGKIIPVVNQEILKEYVDVLNRDKFSFSKDKIYELIIFLINNALFVDSVNDVPIDLPDCKDIKFYRIVMESRKEKNTYLVTGNIRHFPNETYIVTPRQMLEIIENDTCSKIDKL